MNSEKYPRTLHFPFSPGASNDDRIAPHFDTLLNLPIVITEKLDGENTCINTRGVFARSHVSPTQNPWASYLWEKWNVLHNQLDNLELFGESLYAIHSIEYTSLDEYYFLFAIRQEGTWLSWEKVKLYADILQLPTVPVLFEGIINSASELEKLIQELVGKPSCLSDEDLGVSPCEGVVARVAEDFDNADFSKSVLKWVRKNHIQTDEHWTRNWKRAKLHFELKAIREKQLAHLRALRGEVD
jgi:RNA ligase